MNNKNSRGGGIYSDCSQIIIENSTIAENTAFTYYHAFGGGIYALNSNLFITNSDIENNTAILSYNPSYGGGVYLNNSFASFNSCTIASNNSFGGQPGWGCCSGFEGYGGGIYAHNYSVVKLNASVLCNNRAEGGDGEGGYHCGASGADAFGGSIYIELSEIELTNCLLYLNRARGGGGSIGYDPMGDPIYWPDGASIGGAVYADESKITTINTTFYGNSQQTFYTEYCDVVVFNSALDLDNTNYFRHSSIGGYYSNFDPIIGHAGTGDTISEGCFIAEPHFVNPMGLDFHLRPSSPCIDAGAESIYIALWDTTIFAHMEDIYGNPRPSGTGFDIGAHEYQWEDYELSIHGEIGWNLVSSPTVGTHFMTEILEHYESPLFLYDTEDGVYNYWTLLLPGTGYWVLISDTFTNVIADSVLDSVSVELYRGWNLIGTIGRPVPASVITDSSFVIPPVYGYDAASGGYFESSVLLPGRGYWVLTSSNGSVLIRE